jgi:hypothetical protein
MLPGVSSLNSQLLALPPVGTSVAGATQFVNCIATYMNQVQGGPTGSPGIFTYMNAPAIAAIQALSPVADNSWITNFANAIHTGSTSATLVPGTITNPAWTSSLVDIGPVSITTLAAALSTLISGLNAVTSGNNPAMPMAQAIHDYVAAFVFQTTGLIADPPNAPIPLILTFPAQ